MGECLSGPRGCFLRATGGLHAASAFLPHAFRTPGRARAGGTLGGWRAVRRDLRGAPQVLVRLDRQRDGAHHPRRGAAVRRQHRAPHGLRAETAGPAPETRGRGPEGCPHRTGRSGTAHAGGPEGETRRQGRHDRPAAAGRPVRAGRRRCLQEQGRRGPLRPAPCGPPPQRRGPLRLRSGGRPLRSHVRRQHSHGHLTGHAAPHGHLRLRQGRQGRQGRPEQRHREDRHPRPGNRSRPGRRLPAGTPPPRCSPSSAWCSSSSSDCSSS